MTAERSSLCFFLLIYFSDEVIFAASSVKRLTHLLLEKRFSTLELKSFVELAVP